MADQIQNLDVDGVYAFLGTRPSGLTLSEIADRRRELGPNTLALPRRWWWLRSLVHQFTNFFSLLLDVAAATAFVADRLQPGQGMALLGAALLGVSVLNALFAFVQEYRAERAMEALRKYLPQDVRVRRAGDEAVVQADELVPGDVVTLREGDRIPADARLVEGRSLLVNNAPLTGESTPVALHAAASDARFFDSPNLALAGCSVLSGTGVGVVFATGFRTEFGKIALLSHETPRVVSPLERKTAQMVRILTVIAVAMGLLFFAYGVVSGRSLWVNLVFMMGIIVANVPEGLLPTFTLSLALGSLRMARRNVLVKELNAVEALGAVHVICTDKTGTLTMNQLAVTRLAGPADDSDLVDREARRRLLEAAFIACDVEPSEAGFTGDPLDVAIAEALLTAGGEAAAARATVAVHFPFDATRRRAAGIARARRGGVFAVKGAWESLRPLIAEAADPADAVGVPSGEAALAPADAVVHRLAMRGYRVIAVASRALAAVPEAEIGQDALERDLVLQGFICLQDPLRPEVPAAVGLCHQAGIRMIMITGDHPDTAVAVARAAGILAGDAPVRDLVITGDELLRMRERDLVERLDDGILVFARTTPEQKLKIVTALHARDLLVAVTGDGVNDAPALKAADIGVAMGRTGTDVAREAAQVVLLDDNFASIVAGIEEGRTIYANIAKFTNYVLVSNGPEIVPYLIFMVFPVPLALTVIQILSIDLGTDILPSMALGREPSDPTVMKQPPHDRRKGLLTRPVIIHSYLFLGLIEAAFAMSLFFWVLDAGGWRYGEDLAPSDPLYRSATGITLSAIVLMQIGNLVGRRSRYGSGIDRGLLTNPLIVAGVALEIVMSWAILYFPPANAVLGTAPVDPSVYAAAWGGIPLIFGLDYARKRIARGWRR